MVGAGSRSAARSTSPGWTARHWPLALRLLRAGGINLVSTYVFWNHHQPAADVDPDFTGDRDLAASATVRRARPGPHPPHRALGPRRGPQRRPARLGPGPRRPRPAPTTRPTWPPYATWFDRDRRRSCAARPGPRRPDRRHPDRERAVRPARPSAHAEADGAGGRAAARRSGPSTGLGRRRTPAATSCFPSTAATPRPSGPTPTAAGPTPAASTSSSPTSATTRASARPAGRRTVRGGDRRTTGRFPWATCELGGGMAVAYHRRPRVDAADIGALGLTKIGRGSVWQGYYMFHGGTNPTGDLTPPGVPRHRLPQRPPRPDLRLPGPARAGLRTRDSYHGLRLQHAFLDAFGADLAGHDDHLPEPTGRGSAAALVPASRRHLGLPLRQQPPAGGATRTRQWCPVPTSNSTRSGRRSHPSPSEIPASAILALPVALTVGGISIQWATINRITLLDADQPVVGDAHRPGRRDRRPRRVPRRRRRHPQPRR